MTTLEDWLDVELVLVLNLLPDKETLTEDWCKWTLIWRKELSTNKPSKKRNSWCTISNDATYKGNRDW